MKYSISVKESFEARHYVVMPDGKEEEPHGHKWVVEVLVSCKKLDNLGFVMDFHELQKIIRGAAAPMQSSFVINNLSSFKDNPPTAERMAEYFVNQIVGVLPERVKLESVRVEETPGCSAIISLLTGC